MDSVAGRATDAVDYVRWSIGDPSGPGDEKALGKLGEIAPDTLAVDADARLSVTCPTSTGGVMICSVFRVLNPN